MLQVKQRLGDFEIVRPLGKGGMGEVYEAWQFNPPRRVALKVLAPWLAEDEAALQRFWREAAFPAQLDHPGIVRIITTGKDGGVAFYTMQLVQGISLAELMRQAAETAAPDVADGADTSTVAFHSLPASPEVPTPKPWHAGSCPPDIREEYLKDRAAFAVRIGIQAARTLSAAHRQSVLHRDIKPSNLMIDHHRQLYVVDFGLTAAVGCDAELSCGGIRGTPSYMAPEQARGDRGDQRSDIYALGVTLFELVTGGIGPYTANRDNKEAVLAQVKAGQLLPIRSLTLNVGSALERVLRKAMEFKQQRRYQSADLLAHDLEALLIDPTSTYTSPKSVRVSRHRLVMVAGGVLLIAFILAFVLLAAPTFRGSKNDGNQTTDQGENRLAPIVQSDEREYPRERIERTLQMPLGLLNDVAEPIWHHRISGVGSLQSIPGNGLGVFCPMPQPDAAPSTKYALFALDDDPLKRPFEFKAEMSRPLGSKPDENRLGIFFGRRDAIALGDMPPAFFILELVDPSDIPDRQAHVRIGSIVLKDRVGDRTEFESDRPLPKGQAILPLQHSGGWHSVKIRAHKKTILVSVDGDSVREINLAELKSLDPHPSTLTLDPGGALGVWSRNGVGFFREAYVASLPPEE